MKGMRQRFTNKRGRIRQTPMGRVVKLVSGNGTTNRAWRFT